MKNILIIDADQELISDLSHALNQAGYAAEAAFMAKDGLAAAPGKDLIIVCVELPDQNGFVVSTLLKKNPQTAHIPVFIMSSADNTTAFEQHLNLATHADGYFLKPLDVPTMLQEISAIFADIDAANGAMAEAENAAQADMVDVNVGDDSDPEDDSEVIKALSLDDMNLFADIDTDDIAADDDDDASNPPIDSQRQSSDAHTAQPKPAQMPPARASLPPSPAKLPPKPTAKLPPAKTPSSGPLPRPTLTGFPAAAAKSSNNIPLLPTHSRASHSDTPSAAFSSVSQTAIPAADLARLTDEITVLKNEINVLKSEITTRDNRITMLQSQCDALSSRCQNAESIADTLKAEHEQLLEQLDAYAAHDQDRSIKLQEIANAIMALTSQE